MKQTMIIQCSLSRVTHIIHYVHVKTIYHMRNKHLRNIKINIQFYFLKIRLLTNIGFIYKHRIPKHLNNKSIE